MRVLLIEDEAACACATELILRQAGFQVDVAGFGQDGLDLARREPYDLIGLDLNLPDMHGYDLLKALRAQKIETPVLVLSHDSEMDSKVQCLGYGADDYLNKPFARQELIARVLAITRRARGGAVSNIQIGNVIVNRDAKIVLAAGRKVHLTAKEYAIMELLALRIGRSVTKEMLFAHLYAGRDEPDVKILDVFICKLRKKLAAAGAKGPDIATIWGRGYALRDPRFDHQSIGEAA